MLLPKILQYIFICQGILQPILMLLEEMFNLNILPSQMKICLKIFAFRFRMKRNGNEFTITDHGLMIINLKIYYFYFGSLLIYRCKSEGNDCKFAKMKSLLKLAFVGDNFSTFSIVCKICIIYKLRKHVFLLCFSLSQ